jgi:hypothetical protein
VSFTGAQLAQTLSRFGGTYPHAIEALFAAPTTLVV